MGPLLSIFQNGLLAFDINIEDSPSSGYESWISSDGVMFGRQMDEWRFGKRNDDNRQGYL